MDHIVGDTKPEITLNIWFKEQTHSIKEVLQI